MLISRQFITVILSSAMIDSREVMKQQIEPMWVLQNNYKPKPNKGPVPRGKRWLK